MLSMTGSDVETGNASTIEWRVFDDVRPLSAATQRRSITVDPARIEEFRRDGVTHLPGIFIDEVDALRSGLERILREPHRFAFPCESTTDTEQGRFFDAYCNWQRVPEFFAHVLTSPAASIAAQCMVSETAQLFHEHVFTKEGGVTKATPWHHDLPYYCVDGTQTASVYVALDDAPAETAVRFLRRSHLDGNLYRPRTFVDGAEYTTNDPAMRSVDVANVDEASVFSTALRAGDVLVFDFRTLHGTTASPVDARRRAFSTRWLGDDVVYVERPGATSPPLDGLGIDPGDRMRSDWFPVLWP